MKTLDRYIRSLLADGKYFFSRKEAQSALNLNLNQFRWQAARLYQKNSLKNLGHGFFMIIPAEYQHLGSLPPHWIIDPYMQHLNCDYYIGLLSAASFYGATQQQPMVFQVITNKKMKPIQLKRGRIEFHSSKDYSHAFLEQITVPTGYAKISTKEQTLVDLVRFHPICGYLSNVATIIQDLGTSCKVEIFAQVVRAEKTKTALQRLGYILEFVGLPNLSTVVEQELRLRKVHDTLLRPDFHIKKGERINRWKLILNDTLELDE